MNKAIIVATLLLITLISCKKKEVKVPKIALDGIEEVQNNSIIWMFNDNGKLDVNEKNRISSTHWLFNIDKNLMLKEILPEVIRLRTKHNDKSPHNTKRMNNYFSYANSLNDKLSFYRFDKIEYKFLSEASLPIYKPESDTILLKLKKFNSFKVYKKKHVQLAFTQHTTFQDYLFSKSLLIKDSVKIISLEYIFD